MMVFEATNQILLLFVAVFLPLTGKSNLSVCLVLHQYTVLMSLSTESVDSSLRHYYITVTPI